MGGRKGVLLHGGPPWPGKLFRKRIHFLLQGRLVPHEPDPAIPGVAYISVGRLRFSPGPGMLLLERGDEFLYVGGHRKIAMHRGEQQDLGANFAGF